MRFLLLINPLLFRHMLNCLSCHQYHSTIKYCFASICKDKKGFARARLYGIGSKSPGGPQGGIEPGDRSYTILSGSSSFNPGAQFQKEVISDLKGENQFLSKDIWESI